MEGGREGGDTREGAAEQPTDSADVEVELGQTPLYTVDKDKRKSEKSERAVSRATRTRRLWRGSTSS